MIPTADEIKAMRSRVEIAFDLIAGLAAGIEQDVRKLERWWPASKRGSNASRAFDSLLARMNTATGIAREEIEAMESAKDGH